MTLLSPIPALIAAAVTLPALLFFYFLKLKRRPVRVSSTMLFEDAAHDLQVNVPLKWLTPSWLLLLQLIALACLLLAFARPAINLDAPPAERLIILIDRSASMNALDPIDPARTTRLDRAKTRAHEIVKRARTSGSRVMIVTFAGSANAVSGFSSNATQLHAAIDAIEPTDGASNIAAALQLIEAINAGIASTENTGDGTTNSAASGDNGAQGGDNGASLDVALLSDGAFDETEPLNLPGTRVTFESMAAPPLPQSQDPISPAQYPASPTQTSTSRGPDTNNIAIDALSAARDTSDPASVRAFIRLVSTRPDPAAITLTLSLDGQVVRRLVITVPAMTNNNATSSGGEPPPWANGAGHKGDTGAGEANLTERFAAPQGVLLTAEIESNDALAADNTASVVLPTAARPRVLLVTPGGPASTQDTSFLIEDVLGELNLGEVRKVSAGAADTMQRRGELAAFALIIYDRAVPAALPPVPSLTIGASLPIDGLAAAPTDQPTRVLSWRRTDPLMRDVSLDAVVIAESIAFTLDERADATILARGSDGPLIVRLDDHGIKRIVVAFDLSQSTWPLSPSFAIFLSNAVDTLPSFRGGEANSFTTHKPATVRTSDGWRQIRINGPRTIAIDRETQAFTRAAVPLGLLEDAGVYTVSIDGQPAPPITVNLTSRTESNLAAALVVTIGGETLTSMGGSDAPREIWHWFVLAALIALAIEWLVNALMMRA